MYPVFRRLVPATFALALLAPVLTTRPTYAASNATALLQKAVQNTNTVKSLSHSDTITRVQGTNSVKIVTRGEEDEARNREHDTENVTAKSNAGNGRSRTVHYTVDLIFVNGKTYFRSSLDKNKWHKRPGMTFQDPMSGISWQRGRTKVQVPLNIKFGIQSQGSNGTHLHASVNKSGFKGTEDIWVSGGSKSYVTRTEVKGTQTSKGKTATINGFSTYGPFNQPLVIVPPSGAST